MSLTSIRCTLLVIDKNGFVVPLYTIEENVKHSPQPFFTADAPVSLLYVISQQGLFCLFSSWISAVGFDLYIWSGFFFILIWLC